MKIFTVGSTASIDHDKIKCTYHYNNVVDGRH